MERPRPSVRQIEYYLAIAEMESFRRAAQRLGVSQPTLTNQIIAFENALGVQLFERSRAGTVLTAVGRELLPNAHRVLEEFQALIDSAESVSKGPAGTYRLGVTPTLGPYILPHVLPTLHRLYPALKLYIRARDYCLRALEGLSPGVGRRLETEPEAAVASFGEAEVPLLFWTAAAWGSAISVGIRDRTHRK